MTFAIHVWNNRTRAFSTTLYESDGTTELALSAQDVVRFKIGSNGEAPLLDLCSSSAGPGGSAITFTAGQGDCVVALREEDLQAAAIPPGAYDAEVSVYDDSEDAIKSAECGVVHVHPSMLGDVGEDEESSGSSSSSSSSSS